MEELTVIIKCDEPNSRFSAEGLSLIEVTKRRFRAYRMIDGENRLVVEKVLSNLEKDGVITIDTSPVVHGRWEKCENDGFEWYQCSICQNRPLNDHNERPALSDYCPNCGAKMDGGAEPW